MTVAMKTTIPTVLAPYQQFNITQHCGPSFGVVGDPS